MPNRISFDDWDAVQRRRDPQYDRKIKALQKRTGPKRKLPILRDENLEADLVHELRAVAGLKSSVGRRGSEEAAMIGPAARSD